MCHFQMSHIAQESASRVSIGEITFFRSGAWRLAGAMSVHNGDDYTEISKPRTSTPNVNLEIPPMLVQRLMLEQI